MAWDCLDWQQRLPSPLYWQAAWYSLALSIPSLTFCNLFPGVPFLWRVPLTSHYLLNIPPAYKEFPYFHLEAPSLWDLPLTYSSSLLWISLPTLKILFLFIPIVQALDTLFILSIWFFSPCSKLKALRIHRYFKISSAGYTYPLTTFRAVYTAFKPLHRFPLISPSLLPYFFV